MGIAFYLRTTTDRLSEWFLKLGYSGSAQSVALNIELCLAVRAFDLRDVLESFHSEDVSKVDTVLEVAVGARSIRDELVFKDDTLGEALRTGIDPRQTERGKEDWVDSNDRFNELVAKQEPCGHENEASGKIEQVGSEVIFLHSDLADSSVNVAFWLCLHRELGPLFLQLCLELVELVVGHDRRSLHVLLHRGHVLDFLLAHGDHGRSIPLEIFFQKIEFAITKKLSATGVVCLKSEVDV